MTVELVTKIQFKKYIMNELRIRQDPQYAKPV